MAEKANESTSGWPAAWVQIVFGGSLLLRQAAQQIASLIILMVALAACSASIEPNPSPNVAPPLPPPAPVSLVAQTCEILGDCGLIPASSECVSEDLQPGVTPVVVAVNLEDPGGSGQYLFDPAPLAFSIGDTLSVSLTSETEAHTFTIDELGINCSVDRGETVIFNFTLTKSSTYRLYCIPHWSLGMETEITVQ